ncbi:hypothetical protein [Streptomyces microflavus]|uniref:hypothetical protein n=1 Tax=Streptomyces microflavus TaxID=1919 RepID=UPI0036CE42A3
MEQVVAPERAGFVGVDEPFEPIGQRGNDELESSERQRVREGQLLHPVEYELDGLKVVRSRGHVRVTAVIDVPERQAEPTGEPESVAELGADAVKNGVHLFLLSERVDSCGALTHSLKEEPSVLLRADHQGNRAVETFGNHLRFGDLPRVGFDGVAQLGRQFFPADTFKHSSHLQ